MTAQEIFDKVKTHLLTQNAKSEDVESDDCLYRGDSGLMCAVGCLIPDEMYDVAMEYNHIFAPVMQDSLKRLGLLEHEDLLSILQEVHDDFEPRDWPERLQAVADRFGFES